MTRGKWAGVLLAPLGAFSGGAVAADTQWLPHFEVSALHSTNYLLATNPANKFSVSGANVDVGSRFISATPVARFELDGGANTTWLPSDSEFNTFGYYVTTHTERRGQRSEWLLDAGFRRDAVVTADLAWTGNAGGGLGNPSTVDSGRISGKNYRNQLEVTPAASFHLSQRWDLDARAQHLGINFTTLVNGDQVDYKRDLGHLALSFAVNQTSRLGAEVSAMRFSPDAGIEKSSTHSAALRFSSQVSKQSRMYAMAGVARTNPTSALRSNNSNWIAGVGTQHALQISQVFFDLTRSVDGNSTGVLVVRDSLRFTLSRNVGPRAGFYFSAAGIRDGAAIDTPTTVYRSRKYAQGVFGASWKASPELTLQAEVVQAWQSFSGASAEANGTTGRVSMSWSRLQRNVP